MFLQKSQHHVNNNREPTVNREAYMKILPDPAGGDSHPGANGQCKRQSIPIPQNLFNLFIVLSYNLQQKMPIAFINTPVFRKFAATFNCRLTIADFRSTFAAISPNLQSKSSI